MTRTLQPWTNRLPRLFEMDFPKWMSEVFPEVEFGREDKFLPAANLSETDKAFELHVELPGMKPEDVKVEMHDGNLVITGEKHEEQEEQGKTFHRLERRSGSFRRVFPLPAAVDENAIDARFADGVLKITLPKTEEAAPKKIAIKG
jgi:HSP20 family protein